MAKKRKTSKKLTNELDSVYFVKLVVYLVLGSFWLRISRGATELPLPIGFAFGILLTTLEKLQIDRKIEYAMLLVALLLGYWLPIGLTVVIK